MMQPHLLREEQMRMTLRLLRADVHKVLEDQEKCIQLVYDKVRDQLDRIQNVIISGGDAVAAIGNCSSYLGGMDHLTQVYAGVPSDVQRSGTVGGYALPITSTPLSDRMQMMQPPSRNMMMEGIPQRDCTQWGAPPLVTLGHEASPKNSPQKQWCDESQICGAMNATVDYTCFDPLRNLGDDDAQRSVDGSLLSPYGYVDDMRHDQLLPRDHVIRGAKADVIHVGALNTSSNQHVTTSVGVEYVNGRPKAVPIPDGVPEDLERLGIDIHSQCKVLVEFKRNRVLQFESKEYVHPGSCVVVGGDRGEDIGLVTYTWSETTARPLGMGVDISCGSDTTEGSGGSKGVVVGIALAGSAFRRNIGLGSGTVLRLADESDVAQLHTVQVELERRAIDVCSQRVSERALPMTIIDAEYQFDKNKLTFFYEAQQRMDFRELVRDLYKTFRARIWMEAVDN